MRSVLCIAMILLTTIVSFGQTIKPLDEEQVKKITKSIVVEPMEINIDLTMTAEYRRPLPESAINFRVFVRDQIAALKREFKLDAKAVRKLEVASKGVLRQSRLGREVTMRPTVDRPDQVVLWLALPEIRVDRTDEFRIELHRSGIWQGALRKVLTDNQRLSWIDHHVFPLRAMMKTCRLPASDK